jgi:metal-responsive CopG/Arc/MetJ family transcriptional regulator
MTTASVTKTKKILVEFPEDLLRQAEEAASDLSTDRSKLIRSAVRVFLERRKRSQLAKALAEGYQAHAEFDRRVSAEFVHVDSENF